MAWNARSIFNDMLDVRETIEWFGIDVLLVNETWLKPHMVVKVANCDIIGKDRLFNLGGGGVEIIIRRHLAYRLVDLSDSREMEALAVDIHTGSY